MSTRQRDQFRLSLISQTEYSSDGITIPGSVITRPNWGILLLLFCPCLNSSQGDGDLDETKGKPFFFVGSYKHTSPSRPFLWLTGLFFPSFLTIRSFRFDSVHPLFCNRSCDRLIQKIAFALGRLSFVNHCPADNHRCYHPSPVHRFTDRPQIFKKSWM